LSPRIESHIDACQHLRAGEKWMQDWVSHVTLHTAWADLHACV